MASSVCTCFLSSICFCLFCHVLLFWFCLYPGPVIGLFPKCLHLFCVQPLISLTIYTLLLFFCLIVYSYFAFCVIKAKLYFPSSDLFVLLVLTFSVTLNIEYPSLLLSACVLAPAMYSDGNSCITLHKCNAGHPHLHPAPLLDHYHMLHLE